MTQQPSSSHTATDSSFLKNKGVFSFRITSTAITANTSPTLVSDRQTTRLFLNGVIYNKNAAQLLEGVLSQDPAFMNELEGSFSLFILTDSELKVVTDKTSSKKVYYLRSNEDWLVSNDIDALPKKQCEVNEEGLACYIANGYMTNQLTLYKGIYSAKGASIYSFSFQKLDVKEYWRFEILYASEYSEEKLQQDLEHLLVERVALCAKSLTKPLVSLSAGYDARTIIGILHHYLKIPKVNCFSYSIPSNKNKKSDSFLAADIAKKCQYTHTIHSSYNGDFMHHLFENVKYGKCLTNFCEEIEAYNTLKSLDSEVDLIVGEQIFGYFDLPIDNKENTLGLLSIMGESEIRWIKKHVDPTVYQLLSKGLDNMQEVIWKSAEQYTDYHDKKDYLYFEIRTKDVLLPWRENIGSLAGCVHNPLMDSKLLEFIGKLPPAMRKNKILFKRTVEKMFPDLFALGFATSFGYYANWQQEITNHKKQLIYHIHQTDSLLDSYISKEQLITMIHKQSSPLETFKKHYKRGVIFLRKKNKVINAIATIFLGPLKSPKGHSTYPYLLVLRLLMIRIELLRN